MRELRLSIPDDAIELAGDRLWAAGAQAIEEVTLDDGRLQLRSVLADSDATSLGRLGPVPGEWAVDFVDVVTDHPQTWRDYAEPVVVSDRLRIVPAWRPIPEPSGADELVVPVEPGAAFGLGDHPTTRLTAAALDRLELTGATVLDVGCGTGVLGIIAALRGASRVVGIDVAEAAREATEQNAALNGVTIETSTTPLADVGGAFDVVLANILAPALVAMADDLRRVVAPPGRLLISGVLAGAHDHVLAALEPLEVIATTTDQGWACTQLVSGQSSGSSRT